jgi:uncharacterized membrane protein
MNLRGALRGFFTEAARIIRQWLRLNWDWLYRAKSYINSSLWVVPFIALLVEQVIVRLTGSAGAWLAETGRMDPATALFGVSMSGARSALETIVTMTLSFLVFTFGSLLVAVQVAGGQYTPRVIATIFLSNKVVRACVGLFVVTLFFALRTLTEMDKTVDQLNAAVSVLLGLISVVIFLFLIDYAARMLRPVSIVARVGELGLEVIRSVYPASTGQTRRKEAAPQRPPLARTVVNTGASGVVLAVRVKQLVSLAQGVDGVIEVVPQVGDFLAADEPLFHLYGGAGAISDAELRATVASGIERTMEQDPSFAFRILVDIAIKALSAAINDPTTAVLAIDQLHRLLRRVGLQDLRGERFEDALGQTRVVFRTPNWEDYVHLSCTEIRHCGVGSIQIARRMRAMLENLTQTLPAHRHAELRQQLELLDQAVVGAYTVPADLALARVSDSQGLGGTLGVRPMGGAPANESRTEPREPT